MKTNYSDPLFKTFIDRLALGLFSMIIRLRGYRVIQVKSREQLKQANELCREEGFDFPTYIRKQVDVYKKGTVKFLAYRGRKPIATARLSDPEVVNAPFELYGVDEQGQHFEIQRMVTKKGLSKPVEQVIRLALFHAMYRYSKKHGITSWVSGGPRENYLAARKVSTEIEHVDVDFDSISHPLTQLLLTRKILDTCFTLNVSSLCPCKLFIALWKKSFKKAEPVRARSAVAA